MKFRKNPVVIEAFQWTGTEDGIAAISEWAARVDTAYKTANGIALDTPHREGSDFVLPLTINIDHMRGVNLDIATLEGVMRAKVGDWIIQGVKGEFYPCAADIFEETYAPEPETAPEVEPATETPPVVEPESAKSEADHIAESAAESDLAASETEDEHTDESSDPLHGTGRKHGK